MTEYIAEPHRECLGCGGDYQRLARHWTSGTCTPPPVDEPTQELLTGLVIGNATASGNGQHNHVVLPTQHRPFALWIHDQLGWLSHGVRRKDPDEKRPQYPVRTHAHPALDRYRAWYASGDKRIPADVGLTPRIARAWYACDGGLEWPREESPPRIAFSAAVDDRREDIARLLREAGYGPNVYQRRVRLSIPATERFVEWIGDPVPGVEHRWMRDRAVGRRLRAADISTAMERGKWYRQLLALVADALDAGRDTFTADRFDAAVAAPDAAAIADWLGGGSFDDALSIASVPQSTSTSTPTSAVTPGRPLTSAPDVARAIRQAANWGGEPLSRSEYETWRKTECPAAPSKKVFYTTFDGWADACRAAGVRPRVSSSEGVPQYSDDECRDALRRAMAATEPESPFTTEDYATAAAESDPSWRTICIRLGGGRGQWAAAKKAVTTDDE